MVAQLDRLLSEHRIGGTKNVVARRTQVNSVPSDESGARPMDLWLEGEALTA
jgi:hypothetical protein